MADAHKNFAYSVVKGTAQGDTTNPGTGATLTVQAGDGAKFPPPPFNATVWATASQPISTNAEIVTVTDIDGDTFTITRQAESSSSRSVIVGDQIAAAITAKTLTDAEAPLSYWAPLHIAGTAQTGLQTMGNTAISSTNSLFIFPVTIAPNLYFNQVLIGNSLSMVTSNVSANFSYTSLFGLYSMNANTALSLISSNSFSIVESHSSRTITWNFQTVTATSGYASAASTFTTTGPMSSYISGSRIMGLQFGGNISTLTGGVYYMGLLSRRSANPSSRSTYGLSLVGIVGQPLHPLNMASGSLMPIGSASSDWQANNTNQTQWWGRQMVGFVTATSIANFGGSVIPASVALSAIGTTGGAGSTATILPAVTFVST